MSAHAKQEGGTHYKDLKLEPWHVIDAWSLGFYDGNAVKYVARWKRVGGILDLKKAIHYLEKQIEVEELKKARGK